MLTNDFLKQHVIFDHPVIFFKQIVLSYDNFFYSFCLIAIKWFLQDIIMALYEFTKVLKTGFLRIYKIPTIIISEMQCKFVFI